MPLLLLAANCKTVFQLKLEDRKEMKVAIAPVPVAAAAATHVGFLSFPRYLCLQLQFIFCENNRI